jgi:uncharacterized repeat protein (TIGR01451 family)
MPSKLLSALCALGLAGAATAANFDVSNPTEFQAALSTAESNGQNDVINVQPCSGAGCTGNVYNITSPLLYTASGTETFGLTIDGMDSDTRILDGGMAVPIMRIDTTAVNAFVDLIVRGLTFRNGQTDVDRLDGGALYIRAGAERVEVSGSVFDANRAERDGGALYIRLDGFGEAPVLLDDNTFSNNRAFGDTGDGNGGGAIVLVPSFVEVDVVNTEFLDNSAATSGAGLYVGGTEDGLGAAGVIMIDFDFTGNDALSGSGAGAWLDAGFINMRVGGFVSNSAVQPGGGLYMQGYRDITMVNTGFSRNSSGNDGGGLYTATSLDSMITFTNNTFFRNSADERGGGMLVTIGGSTGVARIYNNIVFDNFVTGGGLGSDVFIDNDPIADIPSMVDFFNNALTDLTGFPDASTSFDIVSSAELSAGGNIDDEPILPGLINDIDPSQGAGSPTIDAGLDTAPAVPTDDFEGDLRPFDGDGDGIRTVDIGMDEFVGDPVPEADLAVAITDSPDPVQSGQDLTYLITVTNNGPDAATNVVMTKRLDASLTLVSATFGDGQTCTQPDDIECALGNLPVRDSVVVTVVASTPDVDMTTNLFSDARVVGDEPDPESANDTFTAQTQLLPAGPPMADLAVSIADNPDPAFLLGADITYTVTVDNNGPSTATAVSVSTTLPPAVIFRSAASATGVCDPGPDTGGTVACNLDDLAAGENGTVTIVVTPDPMATPGELTVVANVTAAEEDPNTENNEASEVTTLNAASADLSVTATSSPDEPSINEDVTVTLTVVNSGPSLALDVNATITLPDNATLVSVDPGDCGTGDGELFCPLGDLEEGASTTVRIVLGAPEVAASLVLSAVITSEVSDPDTSDNTVTVTIDVIDVIELIIEGEGGAGALGWIELAALLLALTALRMVPGSAVSGAARGRTGGGAPLALLMALLASALILTVPTRDALAQDSGWYLGASVGQASAGYSESDLTGDLAGRGWTITQPSVDDNDLAWKVHGGYAINRLLAVEAAWVDLGKVTTRFGASVPPNQIDDILTDTVAVHPVLGSGATLAGVLRWQFAQDRLAVYGRVGAFFWNADIDVQVVSGGAGMASGDDSGTDLMYGAGLEWRFNPHWSLTGEWERYRLKQWVDVPTVGVRYRFGQQ